MAGAMTGAMTAPAGGQQRRSERRSLLVISVDGLDYRYLRDCDKLKLRIPNLRKLMKEGAMADGVVGVVPTVTWPSHTTMITGVRPEEHGILSNRRPKSEGGDYYWSADLLKTPTLWHAAHKAGLKSGAVTWPVTVDSLIDFNLPEYFKRRNGGAMDLDSIEAKSTPGLVGRIAQAYPSFPQEWMNDRTRALAVMYLVSEPQPDLILLHFVDLDAEAHHRGPFSREANAVLEYTDELIGRILEATPKRYVVALVSDHGFERTDRVVHIPALLKKESVRGEAQAMGGIVTAKDAAVADALRRLSRKPENGIGREIPSAEVEQFAPRLAEAGAVFEPAPHFAFGSGAGEVFVEPEGKGNHGFWPTRPDYRSVFLLWGNGVKPAQTPEISMLEIAPKLTEILGLTK
ncbi:MAG: alkaline phosphatase family protein [Bryobacteraceae bacterium]